MGTGERGWRDRRMRFLVIQAIKLSRSSIWADWFKLDEAVLVNQDSSSWETTWIKWDKLLEWNRFGSNRILLKLSWTHLEWSQIQLESSRIHLESSRNHLESSRIHLESSRTLLNSQLHSNRFFSKWTFFNDFII